MKPSGERHSNRPWGWTVSQVGRWPLSTTQGGDRYLRRLWISRRGGFYRLAMLVLAAWGAINLIGSGHGLLRLRALQRQEAALLGERSGLVQETRQVQNELSEDPVVSLERGVREKYLKSRPGEIVYHLRKVQVPAGADSGMRTATPDRAP